MAKRKQPKLTQYQIKTEPPYRFLTAVPRFEWRTPWSTPPTQMGAKSKQFGAAHIAGIGITIPPTEFIKAVPKFEWRQPWSVPPTKMGPISRMVGAALIAATGLFAPVFTPPATLDMDWLTPLSTPTPAERGLPTHQQQTIAFTPENFPSCGLVGVDTEGTPLVGGSSVNTIDYTGVTVGDGPNRALVATFSTSVLTVGMTAVWDQGGTNQTMTLIGTASSFNETNAIFGLRNPVGGNNTLRFSWTTAGFPTVSAISLITVDQSSDANAFQNYTSGASHASTFNITVPSKPGDIVVGIGTAAGGNVAAVGDNNIYVDNTGADPSGAGWNVGAASVTFTGISTLIADWVIGAIDVSAYPCPIDTDFISPFAEPTRREAALHPSLQDGTADVYSVTAEVVTVDKWFDALSEPARIDRFNPALYRALAAEYFPDTPNANAGLWLSSFADPVRPESRFSALYQFYTTEYYPDTFTQWFTPLSEPARIERSLTAPDQSVVPYVATEVVTVDKWFDAFSEPARIERFNAALYRAFTSEYYPETFTQWLIPLSEPARTKRSLNTPDQSWVPFVTTETVTVDKWFDPLSEPVRTKPALRAALQPAATQDAKLFPDPANFLEGWSSGLAEPVRQKLGLNTALQSAYTSGYFSFEIITIDKWFDALSEPKRSRPALQASLQTIGSPSFEVVSVDKWYASLSDPKRFRPALHVSLQQTLTQDTNFIPNPSRYEGWYGALSEPQRQQPGLKAAQQVPYSSAYVTAEVITVDKWFSSLSNPTKPKPGDYDHYKGENEFTAIAANMKWYAPLTEPVRQKRGLAVVNQTASFAYPAPIAGEIITVDKWFKSFADPVRPERPADDRYAGENNWEAVAASMEWFAPFTEPVRFKPGLVPATRPPFFASPAVIIIPSLASWWEPFSDPPKDKAGLGTHLQLAFTQDPKLFPNPTRFLEGWYNWWSQPVRDLPQLNAALQRSWTASDRRPVLATITVTMAVTEVNDDVALFAIKVFAGNPPATAVVSLVEIGHGASLTSIMEEGDDGSGTSIVES